MNKKLLILMCVFMIGTMSALSINMNQTESSNGTIVLKFYLENPTGIHYQAYGISYEFNTSELNATSQETLPNNVFDDFTTVLEMNGVFRGNLSRQSSTLISNETTNNEGALGLLSFDRLVDGNLTFKNISVYIRLWNDTTTFLFVDTNVSEPNLIVCTPDWKLGDWGSCNDGHRTADYYDANECGEQAPTLETDNCNSGGGSSGGGGGGGSRSSNNDDDAYEYGCYGIWTCASWSNCVENIQLRTCIRPQGCYSNDQRPNEERYCSIEEGDTQILSPPVEIGKNGESWRNFILFTSIGIILVFLFVLFKEISNRKREELEQDE